MKKQTLNKKLIKIKKQFIDFLFALAIFVSLLKTNFQLKFGK